MAEHEIGFAEGKKEGFVQGKTEGHAEGRAEGFAEGKTEGFAEGKSEGLSEGELKKAREMAKSLKEQNIPMAVIVKSSGLSEEEINSL